MMNTNRRWLTSIFAATTTPLPALPWQSSVRNYVPEQPSGLPQRPVATYAARPQAQAAH